jgi:hypothetical protein
MEDGITYETTEAAEKTLCPQKDLPIKEISEPQGGYRKWARDELILQLKAVTEGPE